MKRSKVSALTIDALIQAGLSKNESVCIMHVLNQKNGPLKPDYTIRVCRNGGDKNVKGNSSKR